MNDQKLARIWINNTQAYIDHLVNTGKLGTPEWRRERDRLAEWVAFALQA